MNSMRIQEDGLIYLALSLTLLVCTATGQSYAESEAEDSKRCQRNMEACVKTHSSRFVALGQVGDSSMHCSELAAYIDCLTATNCGEDKKKKHISDIKSSFEKMGFECDMTSKSSPLKDGRQPEMSPQEGIYSGAQSCQARQQDCTQTFVKSSSLLGMSPDVTQANLEEKFCPFMAEYFECMLNAPCAIHDKAKLRNDMNSAMASMNVNCDLEKTMPPAAPQEGPTTNDVIFETILTTDDSADVSTNNVEDVTTSPLKEDKNDDAVGGNAGLDSGEETSEDVDGEEKNVDSDDVNVDDDGDEDDEDENEVTDEEEKEDMNDDGNGFERVEEAAKDSSQSIVMQGHAWSLIRSLVFYLVYRCVV